MKMLLTGLKNDPRQRRWRADGREADQLPDVI